MDRPDVEFVTDGDAVRIKAQSLLAQAETMKEFKPLMEYCRQLEAENARLKAEREIEFQRGYTIACCNLEGLHGCSEVAFDVFSQAGVTRDEIARMDLTDYDLKALAEIEKGRRGSPYGGEDHDNSPAGERALPPQDQSK